MIIGARRSIYNFAELQVGLSRAAAGLRLVVVKTSVGDQVAGSSGWQITPDLVVIPSFVAAPGAGLGERSGKDGLRLYCRSGFEPGLVVPASLVFVDPGDDFSPAVLRLERRFDDAYLSLDVEEPVLDDQIFVLQHPEGLPQAHLSIGRVRSVTRNRFRHDAGTTAGSSGAPILNSSWKVIGLHVAGNQKQGENEALPMAALLDSFKPTEIWPEIAAAHQLVDVSAVRGTRATAIPSLPDADLLPAAVRWRFAPTEFPADIQSRLRVSVIDPGSGVWVLRPADRARLLRSAGSLDELRRARGDRPIDDAGQAVIDRVLRGPPYALDDLYEAELPYWLQAVRWFAGIVPGLPSAVAINRELERRRSRGRLEEVSRGFRGREAELSELKSWYQDPAGPVMISGIGGVGKSALVARFVLSLTSSDPAVVLWLDFDRVDLDPGEPVSVIRQAYEQLALQVDGVVVPTIDEGSWPAQLPVLASALGASDASPPLVVLDGFEVAQHSTRHERVWRLLETVLQHAPGTRVLVSGRASVWNLVLAGQQAVPMVLDGLTVEDATAWLAERRIKKPELVASVLQITRRVPLALRLAFRLVDDGVSITDLPAELPDTLVDGYLYRRILDRVVDPMLKPVAQDALVLRWITEEMIEPVLGDRIPAGWTSAETFAGLAQEYGLVGAARDTTNLTGGRDAGEGILTIRPEIRQATLRLLELDDQARVSTVDERAVSWYSRHPPDELDDVDRAELAYHLLRLQNLPAAKRVWRDSCARLLTDAEDDLPVDARAERSWLRARTRAGSGARPSVDVWEHEAAEQIRDLLARGHVDPVRDVLDQRPDRSAASPVVLFDAWMAWREGHSHTALKILRQAGPAGGSVANDRVLLEAAVARSIGDLENGDRLLSILPTASSWDSFTLEPEALAVVAARIRLALDLPLEAELAERLASGGEPVGAAIQEILPASDVVLPTLLERSTSAFAFESLGESIKIPRDPGELYWFGIHLDDARRRSLVGPGKFWSASSPSQAAAEPVAPKAHLDSSPDIIARYLAHLAQQRWHFTCTTPILFLAPLLLHRSGPLGRLEIAVLGTLGAFAASEHGQLNLFHPEDGPLNRILEQAWKRSASVGGAPASVSDVVDALQRSSADPGLGDVPSTATAQAQRVLAHSINDYDGASELLGVVLYLSSPDPLDELVRRVVGLTETNTK